MALTPTLEQAFPRFAVAKCCRHGALTGRGGGHCWNQADACGPRGGPVRCRTTFSPMLNAQVVVTLGSQCASSTSCVAASLLRAATQSQECSTERAQAAAALPRRIACSSYRLRGDIGVGAEPERDPTLWIPHGDSTREEPLVVAVMPAQRQGVLPGLTGLP